SSPAPSTTYWRTPAATAAASASSAHRLRTTSRNRSARPKPESNRRGWARISSAARGPMMRSAIGSSSTSGRSRIRSAAARVATRQAVTLGRPGFMPAPRRSRGRRLDRRRAASSVVALDLAPNPHELVQVEDVVAGVHADQVLDRLLAALAVHPDPLALRLVERADQTQVAGAQRPDLGEGLREIRALIVQPVRPHVLIVALDRGTILGEDTTHPVSPHDLAVGEMPAHLEHRPLAGRLRPGERLGGQSVDPFLQLGGRAGEHAQRILVAQEP